MNLFETYGYCVIPKGTLLFRAYENIEYRNAIFFTLKKISSFLEDERKLQLWSSNQDLKILFMISEINKRGYCISSIAEIYKDNFFESVYPDYLEIKQNSKFLNKFIELFHKNHQGWLSSVENRIELEICLTINKEDFDTKISFISYLKKDDYLKDINSLNDIQVFPSQSFYQRTKLNNTFESYQKMKEAHKTQFINDLGLSENEAINEIFDLRLKLKI